MTRPRRLLLLGSVLVDVVVEVPRLPVRGGDVLGSHSCFAAGGGLTVLTGAARLGLRAAYGGAHGSGPMGDQVRADLDVAGVEVLLDPVLSADTGYCVVLVEPDGERTFVTAPGVEAAMTAEQLSRIAIRPDDAVYVSGYDLLYQANGPLLGDFLPRLAAGPLLVVDPGPLGADIPAERWEAVAARADLISLTSAEARARYDTALPPRPAYVLRQGARGAVVVEDGRRTEVPGVAVSAVDTTGAGDVHVGAMLAALSAGAELTEAVRTANRAAAYSVLRQGPGTGPTLEELAGFPG